MTNFIMGVLYLIYMGMTGALLGFVLMQRRQKKQERKQAVIDGYPWDWTKEQERKVEAAMELICDKCKDNDRLNPNETMEECAMCAVRDSLYRLASSRCDR